MAVVVTLTVRVCVCVCVCRGMLSGSTVLFLGLLIVSSRQYNAQHTTDSNMRWLHANALMVFLLFSLGAIGVRYKHVLS